MLVLVGFDLRGQGRLNPHPLNETALCMLLPHPPQLLTAYNQEGTHATLRWQGNHRGGCKGKDRHSEAMSRKCSRRGGPLSYWRCSSWWCPCHGGAFAAKVLLRGFEFPPWWCACCCDAPAVVVMLVLVMLSPWWCSCRGSLAVVMSLPVMARPWWVVCQLLKVALIHFAECELTRVTSPILTDFCGRWLVFSSQP